MTEQEFVEIQDAFQQYVESKIDESEFQSRLRRLFEANEEKE